jgi:hypothetical protein
MLRNGSGTVENQREIAQPASMRAP